LLISEFVVGAKAIFFNAYLSLQALKKINNKLTNVGRLYLIGSWFGKEQVFFVFYTLENESIHKKQK